MSASVDVEGAEISAHEATKTYLCKAAGCEGEARSRTGRYAYCTPCQVARGSARPDGVPIVGVSLPNTPGSRSARDKARSARAAGKKTQTVRKPKAAVALEPVGAFESAAHGLLRVACELDDALETYRSAKPRLEEAIRNYRETLRRVIETGRGNPLEAAGAAATNGQGEESFRGVVHELAEETRAEQQTPATY